MHGTTCTRPPTSGHGHFFSTDPPLAANHSLADNYVFLAAEWRQSPYCHFISNTIMERNNNLAIYKVRKKPRLFRQKRIRPNGIFIKPYKAAFFIGIMVFGEIGFGKMGLHYLHMIDGCDKYITEIWPRSTINLTVTIIWYNSISNVAVFNEKKCTVK